MPLRANTERTRYYPLSWAAVLIAKPDILSEKDLEDLRHNIAHLSPQSLRDVYARSHEECHLVYNRLPSPKKVQTLIQIWKHI